MITITLPDGAQRQYDHAPTGEEIAASIGPGLAKAALAVKVDGRQRDLYLPIEQDAQVAILTAKQPEGLEIMRHTTTAQLLARAVKELYPTAKLAIGPTIDNGFYYDVEFERPLSVEDLDALEAKMRSYIEADLPVRREMWNKGEAIAYFEKKGEPYKAEIIRSASDDDTTERGKVSLYRQGDADMAYVDLCRGPHVPRTGMISPAFKLTKVAGAYWRGDAKNAQLTRIYGTGWADKKDLQNYLTMIEEAEKRDHRKLGREMDLFHIQEEAMGSIFWHPAGYVIYNQLENYIRRRLRSADYVEVKTPQLLDSKFWEQSGHWSKFRENMFVVPDEIPSTEGAQPVLTGKSKLMALKPMNCPAHVQIFKQGIKSYRDLPLRMAEFGCCHRNEPHGALHGLMRVRQMTQDDAHIFCRKPQITHETAEFCKLLKSVYADLGFSEVKVKFSTRPEVFAGTEKTWEEAESYLKEAVESVGLEYTINPGEGAFYGPKLEFVLQDAIGRDWQCGTLQLDFILPHRLGASYINEEGDKSNPVMLHRAILGSMERFIGILIEQYAGKFPLWLAPVQAVVTTITNEADDYAAEVQKAFFDAGLRSEIDTTSNKINYKVREHSNRKVPYILAVGGREMETRSVAVRTLGEQGQKVMTLDEALAMIRNAAAPPA